MFGVMDIARFAKESAAPNRTSSAGYMPAKTGKPSVDVGHKHLVIMRNASLRMLSMRHVCVLRHEIGAKYSAVKYTKERAEMRYVLTCTPSGSRKSPQQRDLGGEFFVQRLEVVMESKRPDQL